MADLVHPVVFAACLCSLLSVTLATLVVAEFVGYVSSRYRERYVNEAAIELDDVLLQVPANRIFDVSLACSAFGGFMTATLMGVGSANWSWVKGVGLSLLVAGLAFTIPRVYLRILKKQRMKKFNQQLEGALSTISSSLKAGFSINQALEAVVENLHPISVEFRLLVQEIRLGVPFEEALEKMVRRLDSGDFELVATAVMTARQTGGELTVILDRLANVIRERLRITNKLNALTAQGRMQAGIIGMMPFALLMVLSWVRPQMMNNFFQNPLGMMMIGAAALLVGIGFLVIRKILSIDI